MAVTQPPAAQLPSLYPLYMSSTSFPPFKCQPSLCDPQEFNARTTAYVTGTPLPCRVIVRPNRTFTFDIRTPQTSWLILNAAKIQPGSKGKRRGANKPGHESVGSLTLKHIYEIAKIKASEERLSGIPLEGVCRSIIFQCRSMGIDVVP